MIVLSVFHHYSIFNVVMVYFSCAVLKLRFSKYGDNAKDTRVKLFKLLLLDPVIFRFEICQFPFYIWTNSV